LKSETHQELLNAIAINDLKKAAYSAEPFADEQLIELEKAEKEKPQLLPILTSFGEFLMFNLATIRFVI
jgi:hypothetical protein